MEFTKQTFTAALMNALPAAVNAVADSVFGPTGEDPKSLVEKAHAIQAKRAATAPMISAFNVNGAQPTTFRVVSNYRDDINFLGQGQTGGIMCFDPPKSETIFAFDGFSNIQLMAEQIDQKLKGSAGVQAYVGSDWYWVATGEKLTNTDLASVDGSDHYVKANSLTVG